MGAIPALWTMMFPDCQTFPYHSKTVRAGLACPVGRHLSKIHPPFPAHPLQQGQKLSKCGIRTILAQHPPYHAFGIEVFGKDSLRLVAKFMSRLQMEVFATVGNTVMQSADLELCLLPILRPLAFSCRSALQQFQLTLQSLEKLRALLKATIGNGQKPLQS